MKWRKLAEKLAASIDAYVDAVYVKRSDLSASDAYGKYEDMTDVLEEMVEKIAAATREETRG
jgi:hypothetical protein